MLRNAALYKNGKKESSLTLQELKDKEFEENSFFWAALVEPSHEETIDIFSKLKVHELAIEDVEHGGQIAKIEEYDENLSKQSEKPCSSEQGYKD